MVLVDNLIHTLYEIKNISTKKRRQLVTIVEEDLIALTSFTKEKEYRRGD